MSEQQLSAEASRRLLDLAHNVVTWTTQATINRDAAGYPHLVSARRDYYRARIDEIAKVRELRVLDYPGCSCPTHDVVDPDCLYHYAASVQPDNHHIPWNCPTYYDGCNCANRT
jgi:hypothetical protein